MSANIYDQHRASFPHVSAFVIAQGGRRVGTVAFKFPRDGAGRLYCYLQVFGMPMARGFANGYGYDKKSAACESAAERIAPPTEPEYADDAGRATAIKAALAGHEGYDWDRRIRDAGFEVWQAV
jgi:hypothetical protein